MIGRIRPTPSYASLLQSPIDQISPEDTIASRSSSASRGSFGPSARGWTNYTPTHPISTNTLSWGRLRAISSGAQTEFHQLRRSSAPSAQSPPFHFSHSGSGSLRPATARFRSFRVLLPATLLPRDTPLFRALSRKFSAYTGTIPSGNSPPLFGR